MPVFLPTRRASGIRRRLLAWYRVHKRPLPWRGETDPYFVWVSELMLQQTQAAAVVPYYRRFVQRFPSMSALARAPLGRVLKAWEGLGYYRRARYLHDGARRLMREHGGRFPRDYALARKIPGVGEYTAGAVLSIAYGLPLPALDANAARVLSRLFAEPDAAGPRLRRIAALLVPKKGAGEWTQALMELGALVCSPRRPRCGECPLQRRCRARALGSPDDFPQKTRRAAPKAVRAAAAVLAGGGRFLLRRRRERFLGGLWEFPWWEVPEGAGAGTFLPQKLRWELGLRAKVDGKPMLRFTQVYSHRKIAFEVYAARSSGRALAGRWIRPAGMESLPMGAAQRKIARFLTEARQRFPG